MFDPVAEDQTVPVGEEADQAVVEAPVEDLVVDDLLVEDVSIDGMCGVY